jgi:hypothetical protein
MIPSGTGESTLPGQRNECATRSVREFKIYSERTAGRPVGHSGDHPAAEGAVPAVPSVLTVWAAHDQAVAAAWSAPGVTQADDRIRVESMP